VNNLLATVGLVATLMIASGPAWSADTAPTELQSGSEAGIERYLMEGTEIQGTLEKPHVVYVVPWNDVPSATGDIPLRRSFREELLEPVERARFQRQISQGSSTATGGGLK